MNPQDQNTYMGPPPRAVDHTLPPDPYIDQLNPQAYAAPYNSDQAYQAPVQAVNPDPSVPPVQPPVQPVATPEQSANPNQYNTPELSAQIQMAQQAGQAAGGQTVSAQMMAQNPPEPGTAKQVYKQPLVISNGIARAFAYLAFITVAVAVANFIVNQFQGQFADSAVYATIVNIISRINTVALFARIACVGFAVVATVIRVYNPHPYNTKNAITGWVFAIIALLGLVIFR